MTPPIFHSQLPSGEALVMGEEPPSLTERNGSALWLAARDRLASSYHPAKANFVPFFFFLYIFSSICLFG